MGIYEESIRERRSRLEHRIEQLRRDLLEACAELNTLIHVERLPPEILVGVFLWLQEICVEAGDADERIVVSHVCSRWREVALRCKDFWTNIHLPSHSAYIRTAIERSQDATITVLFPSKRSHRKAAAEDIEAILPAMNRVGRLRLSLESANCLASSTMKPHSIDTPRLIELHEKTWADPMLLSFLDAPNLTSLTLRALHPAVSVVQILVRQTQLASLTIWVAVGPASLLEALRHLPNLCTLTVAFMRGWLSDVALPTASLPKLNALNLHGPLSHSSRLLSQLEYPAYVQLSVFPDCSQDCPHVTPGDPQALQDLREIFRQAGKTMARADEQTHMVEICVSTEALRLALRTTVKPDVNRTRCSPDPDGTISALELEGFDWFSIFLVTDGGRSADSLSMLLHAIKDGLLPVADIQEFRIATDDTEGRRQQRWTEVNQAKMADLFRCFKNVDTLQIGYLSYQDVSSILLPSSSSLDLPFPALHTLQFLFDDDDDNTPPCTLPTDSLHQHLPSCHHHLSHALEKRGTLGAAVTRLGLHGTFKFGEDELAELKHYVSEIVSP